MPNRSGEWSKLKVLRLVFFVDWTFFLAAERLACSSFLYRNLSFMLSFCSLKSFFTSALAATTNSRNYFSDYSSLYWKAMNSGSAWFFICVTTAVLIFNLSERSFFSYSRSWFRYSWLIILFAWVSFEPCDMTRRISGLMSSV